MIEVMEVNMVNTQVRGIWDDEEEKLLTAMGVQGISKKGMTKTKKKDQEKDAVNVTRSGKHVILQEVITFFRVWSSFVKD